MALVSLTLANGNIEQFQSAYLVRIQGKSEPIPANSVQVNDVLCTFSYPHGTPQRVTTKEVIN